MASLIFLAGEYVQRQEHTSIEVQTFERYRTDMNNRIVELEKELQTMKSMYEVKFKYIESTLIEIKESQQRIIDILTE